MQTIIGWDIGGAHLKVAVLGGAGQIEQAIQQPCPLWKGLGCLRQAVSEVLPLLPNDHVIHAITMTGELVDCFESREQGVASILSIMQILLQNREIHVYAGRLGFLKLAQVNAGHCLEIASANWLATAKWLAKQKNQALMVDIGSTTTDILRIDQGQVLAHGYSDYARLISGELFYNGVVRTAVMAVAQQAEFNGRQMGLMTEYFATMADVYRLTGDLQPEQDQAETADGQDKSPEASARRLSRMTGYEFNVLDWPIWLRFAEHLKQRQLDAIESACLNVSVPPPLMVGAGVGRFLVQALASKWSVDYLEMSQLFPANNAHVASLAADCAPAAAVACLYQSASVSD